MTRASPADGEAPSAGPSRRSLVLRTSAVAILLAGLAITWRFTPLAQWINPEGLTELAAPIRGAWWGPLASYGLFVIAGTLMVPITAMIVANALLFDTLPALASTIPGVLTSAAIGYGAGSLLWREAIDRISGGRFGAINDALSEKGLLAVAAIRVVPIAPFAVVNLVAGASKLEFRDYMAGTALSMVPGMILMTLAATGIAGAVRDPSPVSIGLAVGAVLVLVAVGHLLTRWLGGRSPGEAPSGNAA